MCHLVSHCRNEIKNQMSQSLVWNTVVEILILVYKKLIYFLKPDS